MSRFPQRKKLFRSPFSREYWALALSELKNPKTLAFAALILALRVALKPVKIPIAADLSESLGFIVNAFGAIVYGPVVALLSGVLSDTLGYLLFPSGPYFPGFILTEMAGGFVFALFLYRAEVSVPRLLLARFCICFFVNVVLAYPIWVLYYRLMLGKEYAIALIRVLKNLALFPLEAVILSIVFRYLLPPFRKMGYILSGTERLAFTRRHAALLAVLTLLGLGCAGGYIVYHYDHTSLSASYSAQERLQQNLEMRHIVAEELSEPQEESLVVIIESASSSFFSDEITYQVAVYRLNQDLFTEKQQAQEADSSAKSYSLETVNGYSKSPAAKDDALERIASAVIVTNKKTGEKKSIEIK